MIKHRGEIVKDKVNQSGFSKTLLAERLKVSRATLYNKFDEHNLDWETIVEIGKIINYDFGKDFTELSKTSLFEEDRVEYNVRKSLQDCREELDHWRKKAFEYMEKYNQLLEQNSQIRNRQTG